MADIFAGGLFRGSARLPNTHMRFAREDHRVYTHTRVKPAVLCQRPFISYFR